MFARLTIVWFAGTAFLLGTLASSAAADAFTNGGGWVTLTVGLVAATGAVACALWALVALLMLRIEWYFPGR
jgi:hypothetical protein